MYLSTLHRDLKPGNVMLADDDNPIIMDFGSMSQGPEEIKGRSQAVALQVKFTSRIIHCNVNNSVN